MILKCQKDKTRIKKMIGLKIKLNIKIVKAKFIKK